MPPPPLPPPAPAPIRTARTSLVLRHVGFHSTIDDDDPIVRLVAAFLTRVPTWLSALHRDIPEETALWAVQWLVAQVVPEEDSWYRNGQCIFYYTPMDRAAKRGYLSVVQFLHEHSAHACTKYAVEHAERDMDMLQFLYDNRWELEDIVKAHKYIPGKNEWLKAASHGNLDELKRVHALMAAAPLPEYDWQVIDAIRIVIGNGYVDVLQWLHESAHVSSSCFVIAIDRAIEDGDLDAVRFVLEHRVLDSYEYAMDKATEEGQLEIMKLIRDRSADGCTSEAFEHAARHGSVEMLQLLCEYSGEHCTSDAMDAAAAVGSLEVVRYLHEHRTEGCSTRALDQAAANGHVEVVQFLVEHRHEGCTTVAMDEAAANGHLEIVQFLHEHRPEGCTAAAITEALSNDHEAVALFLLEHRPEGSPVDAMESAAANGHVEIVKFLYEHQTEACTKAAFTNALWNDHVAVVRFLLECCKDDDMLDHAAVTLCIRNRRFELLRCLHDSGRFKLSPDDFLLAAAHHSIEVVEFLYDHCGIPEHNDRMTLERQAIEEAAMRGSMDVVVWLDSKRRQGESLTSRAIEYASYNNHLEVAEYLLEHGHDGPIGRMQGVAASKGRLDLVQYLQEQRPDGCNHDAIASAVYGGHLEIVRYLCDHRTCDHRLDTYVTDTCIRRRQFDLLVYLFERDLLQLKPEHLVRAIKASNQVEMLAFLYDACVVSVPEKRMWVLRKAVEKAAKLRAMSVLEFIDSKRLDGEVFLPSKAMEYAATRGHLEIVEYLVTHGHDGCTGAVMNLAAFRGRLDVVQYLHETRGDGFNEKALELAERKDHTDVVAYMNEHRGRVVLSNQRVSACRCRFCAEGNVVPKEPTSPWGDDGDY